MSKTLNWEKRHQKYAIINDVNTVPDSVPKLFSAVLISFFDRFFATISFGK